MKDMLGIKEEAEDEKQKEREKTTYDTPFLLGNLLKHLLTKPLATFSKKKSPASR